MVGGLVAAGWELGLHSAVRYPHSSGVWIVPLRWAEPCRGGSANRPYRISQPVPPLKTACVFICADALPPAYMV